MAGNGFTGLLAALAGGMGGYVEGTQLQQRLAQQREEAEARKRAELLQQLETRDRLGLVEAPQYQGSVGAMLRATPTPTETGTALDAIVPALKSAAGPLARAVERPGAVSMQDPMTGKLAQYLMDPTQSRGARDRAVAQADARAAYVQRREDAVADRTATMAQQQLMAQQARAAADQARAENNQVRREIAAASDATRRETAQQSADLRRDLRRGRPIPNAAMTSMIENDVSLSRVNTALSALTNNPGAVGVTNIGPGAWLKNNVFRATPADIGTRAAVADIGSQIIHDRSGAAVTISEYPRLAPFVPSQSDSPTVARAKLERLGTLMAEEAALYRANYGPDQGFEPFRGTVRSVDAPAPARGSATSTQSRRPGETPAQYLARTGGGR